MTNEERRLRTQLMLRNIYFEILQNTDFEKWTWWWKWANVHIVWLRRLWFEKVHIANMKQIMNLSF